MILYDTVRFFAHLRIPESGAAADSPRTRQQRGRCGLASNSGPPYREVEGPLHALRQSVVKHLVVQPAAQGEQKRVQRAMDVQVEDAVVWLPHVHVRRNHRLEVAFRRPLDDLRAQHHRRLLPLPAALRGGHVKKRDVPIDSQRGRSIRRGEVELADIQPDPHRPVAALRRLDM